MLNEKPPYVAQRNRPRVCPLSWDAGTRPPVSRLCDTGEPSPCVLPRLPVSPLCFLLVQGKNNSIGEMSVCRGVSPMLAKVRQAIADYSLFKCGERVVAGVSGGVDSVVLLHVLSQLEEYRLELYVAHLDHGLRPESADEADFVRELAAQYHLPFYHRRVELGNRTETERNSIGAIGMGAIGVEEAARRERYGFLTEVAARTGATRIAVAHHADDQAETVLLQLLRGAGLQGIAGMEYLRKDGVCRPLLGITRREIENYAVKENLHWVEDSSNASLDFRRNRIRHELLPMLAREYNPNVRDALLRLAAIARSAEGYITTEADRFLQNIAELSENLVVITIESFLEAPEALQREMLRIAARTVKEDGVPSFERIEVLRQALAKGGNGRVFELGGGLTAAIADGRLSILMSSDKTLSVGQAAGERVQQTSSEPRPSVPLPFNGTVQAADYQMVINCTVRPWRGDLAELKAIPRTAACFDLDRIGREIVLRDWQEQETFIPFGRRNPVKVGEFLSKEGVGACRRSSVPVVADENGILWVVGYRPSAMASLNEESHRALVINIAEQ